MHGWPSLATPSLSLKSDEFPRRFEGAVDFDRIFTGAGRVPTVSVRGHLGPSLSKSVPPHEPYSCGWTSLATPSPPLRSDGFARRF